MCFGRTVSALLTSALALGSCKKEDDVQYPPSPPQNFAPADAGAPAPAPTTTDAAVVDAAPPELDSATKQSLGFALEKRAAKDARGMTALGEMFGARLVEGQEVDSRIMIESGKCYAVIAVGEASVLEVDVQIFNPALGVPGGPGTLLAVDNTRGSEAVISPCWKNVFPVGFPGRVVVSAKRGSGAVAARVYVK